jgi:hypothetical protein
MKADWNGQEPKMKFLASTNEILEGFIFASPFLQKLRAQIKI